MTDGVRGSIKFAHRLLEQARHPLIALRTALDSRGTVEDLGDLGSAARAVAAEEES